MKYLKKLLSALCLLAAIAVSAQDAPYPANYARAPRFKALLYYSDTAEPAHVEFARDAIEFFKRLTWGEGYILDVTTSLADYPYERLKDYSVIIAINNTPAPGRERKDF